MSHKEPQSLLQHHATKGEISPDSAWQKLQNGITEILHHKSMKKEVYLGLYNLVYQYCTSCSVTMASETYRQREVRSTEFLGQQLYNNLTDFLKKYLLDKSKQGCEKCSDVILAFYYDNWEQYTFSSNVIHNIFQYLNRHWVRREMEDGNKKVYEIYSLLLVSWRTHFLGVLLKSITSAVLKLIENDRSGKAIESKFIQCIVQSYVELGIENSLSSRGRILTYYKDNFEKQFLQETKEFYQKESSEFLRENTVTAYVSKTSSRLAEEKNRSERLLHESTLSPLIALCEEILISQYLPQFQEEFQRLLDAKKTEDIGRMYQLVSRVKRSLEPMKTIFQNHIKNQGLNAVETVKDKAQTEPQEYARALLGVMITFKGMVVRAFGNGPLFVQALDEACRAFINENAVTKETNKNKTSELLARYSDILLKKSSKLGEEAELEDVLQDIVTLLQYVEDKDVFSKFYGSRLAKRLINNLSVSEDAERSMILKLKEAFGSMYIEKMERMFKDIELSKGLNDQFREHLKRSNIRVGVELSIQVLTQGHWPFPQCGEVGLPKELHQCIQQFTAFYVGQHGSRRLNWDYAQSSGDIIGNFDKRKYTFTVSTYQMAILLQFNQYPSRTFEQLHDNTLIDSKTLELVVRTLMKLKLLLGENVPQDESASIPNSAIFFLFEEFRHKKVRVNINVPLRLEVKKEEEIMTTSIEIERRHEIDAAVVRIMKSRKTLQHNELLAEAVKLLQSRFKPTFQAIKKRIEDLIERNYLERARDQKDVYNYCA